MEQFTATRWTLVRKARGPSEDARIALSELCAAYYAPVHAFVQCSVRDNEAAKDLTQEFFTRVLSGRAFDGADPERGKFRSFLLGAVKHFLADVHDHSHTQKRGGDVVHESIEPGTDTSPGIELIDSPCRAPDATFDRNWAHALLDRALVELLREFEADGKKALFEALKPALTGSSPLSSYAQTAQQLGMSEGAVKVAAHRLRSRFRELVKSEIAQTLVDSKDTDAELRHLIAAVSQ